MFKKKDLAIAVAMALSVSPASLAQTEVADASVEEAASAENRSSRSCSSFRGCSGHNFGEFQFLQPSR